MLNAVEYLGERGFVARIENGELFVENHNCFFADKNLGKIEKITQESLENFVNGTEIIPTFFV